MCKLDRLIAILLIAAMESPFILFFLQVIKTGSAPLQVHSPVCGLCHVSAVNESYA